MLPLPRHSVYLIVVAGLPIQFIEPVIAAGIPDLLLFPRKNHSIGGMDARNELFERILKQFKTYLK